jgi:hypothetical protein
MSLPNSATRQPAPYSPLRALVVRHPAEAFLVLAFGFGWTSLIPILLSENGFGFLPIELPLTVIQTLATVLGLALPAFLVTAATGGKERSGDRRVHQGSSRLRGATARAVGVAAQPRVR